MNIGKAFTKIFYREASKYIDQRAKQSRKDKHVQEVQAKYAEERRQNEIILREKIKFLQDKIDIAELYLRNEVKIHEEFEKRKKSIENWFYHNYWLKTISERQIARYTKKYTNIYLSIKSKEELLNNLQLNRKHYVTDGYSSNKSEDTTLVFIIEHTPVIEELKNKLDKEGYQLLIYNDYTSYGSINTSIYFCLIIKEDAKQPF
jgi:hypothetical protein